LKRTAASLSAATRASYPRKLWRNIKYLVKLEALESEIRDDEMADATLDLLRDKAPKNRGSFRDSITDNFRVIKPKDFRVLT
jgi:hypothetical protein